MKFYTILLATINVLLLNTKVKSTLYHGRKLGQIAPVPFQPLLLGLRRMRQFTTCSENNKLANCPTRFPILPLIFGPKRVQSKSKINYSERPDIEAIHNYANLANVHTLTLPGRLTRPKVFPVNKFNLILGKPSFKPVFRNIKTIEYTAKKANTMENSTEMVETVKTLSETVETIVNPPKTCTEKEENEKMSVEEAETTTKFVDNSISPEKENVTPTDLNNFNRQNIYSESLILALDQFERKLYKTNVFKFLAITPPSKGNNGMSFVQSGLFLELVLMALSTEVDLDTKNELDQNFGLNVSDVVKIKLIKKIIDTLPNSSEGLKFRWSSRLVLRPGLQPGRGFSSGTTEALRFKINHFNDTQPEAMARALNIMIEEDSEGSIRDTFDEEDLSENEQAVLVSTLYFRARWRSAPTLLNGSLIFRESGNALPRTVRMIRVNDIMKYVDIPEWDAEAIEIPYLTQGLSLLMLVPRGNSLRHLVGNVTSANLRSITDRMQDIRISVALPLYTLRMTLLLPDKLRAMGISRIVDTGGSEGGSLRISQAVQRIMFWAEAGRNAYKDDGLEWDETPQMKIVVDRPYVFCVRWHHLTLMIGNFVL